MFLNYFLHLISLLLFCNFVDGHNIFSYDFDFYILYRINDNLGLDWDQWDWFYVNPNP